MFARSLMLVLSAILFWSAVPAQASWNNCGNGVVNRDEECDDANTSSTDGCTTICHISEGWTCTGSPSVCTQTGLNCGNGVVDSGEGCDDANTTSGDGCQSDCTVQSGWECTGTAPSECAPTETEINCGNGIVDSGEDCDGGACCIDCTFATSTTTCRASAGACDLVEVCSGSSSSCPSDAHSTNMCRASTGACDPAEFCSSASTGCPADSVRPSTFVCRASAGSCDVAERCDGSTAACPVDTVSPNTTVCRPAVSTSCDVAETCTGTSGACPADVLLGCPDTDGVDCVHPACDVSGQCTTSDECQEICRQPNFWARRSGVANDGESLIQTILDQAGSLSVCGQTIDSATGTGDLDSALEALCVQARGVDERDLFRQLVTTALNCEISEGGTCDQILSRFIDVSFSDCSALCAGTPVPGSPTVDECIDQLSCFNSGGQVVDGQCARGTCENDPGQLCGGDFGSCPGTVSGGDDGDDDDGGADLRAGAGGLALGHGKHHANGLNGNNGENGSDNGGDGNIDDDGCEPFAGNCADARLCTTTNSDADVQICPHRVRPSNQRLCQQARKNSCTIDSCD